ncbi:MAG: hypothetical protein A3C13_03985 [Candidatus Lloydbacteria bacterium RIFCSPHIGHO2_02_FULL_50_11]|nr:MAG: hypothetical protein A3C13_03985 [Candidatus Lloydbacteria bacterium RIFCSPHIGHO2_02_FULL_50_11]
MLRIHKILKAATVIAVFLTLGCTTTGTIQNLSVSAKDQAENLPIRKLRTHIVFDDIKDLSEIRRALELTSDILRKQSGIELDVDFSAGPLVWVARDRCSVLSRLHKTTAPRKEEFDVAIGFTRFTAAEIALGILGTWLAVTDDTYRRYIVTRSLSPWVVAHELGHVFILDHAHSESGLMQPGTLPFIPLAKWNYYLSPEDRKEVLRNKWRKFGDQVTVPDVEDPIKETCG